MQIRITRSSAGPHGAFNKGAVLKVGQDIDKQVALQFLNGGLAVAVADVGVETAEFPVHTGGGWYRLSDGRKVQGKEAAEAAEAGE